MADITFENFSDMIHTDFGISCSDTLKDKLAKILLSANDLKTEFYGRLVLKLAIDESIDPDDPMTNNLIRQYLENTCGFKIPATMKISVLRRAPDEFVMMLPPKEIAEAAICVAKDTDATNVQHKFSYKVPDPYEEKYHDRWKPAKTELDFLQFIIGDYTMRYCR